MKQELEVQMIGHACLRIEGRFGALLCDPWFLNEPIFDCTTWRFPAAVVPPSEVVRDLDYLFITHAHEDHFHIPSIDYISRDVQVLLVEYDHHPGLRAQTIERTMRALGFHRIRKLRSWETVSLSDEVTFTVIPAARTRTHDWENAGFVIDHPGCRLINMNDNIGDARLYREVAERFSRFDIGFVQAGGVSMYPGCYRMSQEQMLAEAAKRIFNPAYQKAMIDGLKLDRIVPFAADFCWLDDQYFHCNQTNRSTPLIFTQWIERDYPPGEPEVVVMYPSDTWSASAGLTRRHPEIDWHNYLDEIRAVKARFADKVAAARAFVEASDQRDLLARSRAYTAHINRWICQEYIDFTGRFRLVIEGADAGFSFVLKASPQAGFRIDWDDDEPVDQTLYIPQAVWAGILEGRLMWNPVQWASQNEQHVPYRIDLGRFWFWLEFYIDLNNRSVQALVESIQHPHLGAAIRPQWGTFPQPGEWEAVRQAGVSGA
ncbi:MAG TPA: MBL fold metallo-hydrolase [Blastocatellia bacterium]|nr:MBL fold metallo-hydrolase [Blastocatellia bacterium]